jgi:hypothetical protein
MRPRKRGKGELPRREDLREEPSFLKERSKELFRFAEIPVDL